VQTLVDKWTAFIALSKTQWPPKRFTYCHIEAAGVRCPAHGQLVKLGIEPPTFWFVANQQNIS